MAIRGLDGDVAEESLGLIHVSNTILVLAVLPMLSLAGVSRCMGLDLEIPMIIGSVRAALQLLLCGYILSPVFLYGDKSSFYDFGWLLVLVYICVMICLASYEVSRRSKYCFRGMYLWILTAFALNIGWVACFTFLILLKPKPFWQPTYVIPIVGMLLGNCINGVALSLDRALTSLVEQASEVDLLLAFGASCHEATKHIVRDAVRVGAVPTMNSLSVIGIVSIPGMMTGQILGGAPVIEAARYQILIIYLIAACGLSTILSQMFVVQRLTCDFSQQRLKGGSVVRREDLKTTWSLKAWLRSFFDNDNPSETSALIEDKATVNAIDNMGSKTNGIQLTCSYHGGASSSVPRLEIHKVSLSFPDGLQLFSELSYTIEKGALYSLLGPSGSGKSQFLRLVAALTAMDNETVGDLILDGLSRKTLRHPEAWRRMVRYVSQSPVSITGTPRQFIKRVASLKSWQSPGTGYPLGPTEEAVFSEASAYALDWGLQPSVAFDSEWKQLSGGEAQRVFVAVCLASKPKVLLMDESTSALDMDAKVKVEEAVVRVARENNVTILWVSHDEEQLERLRAS